MTGGSNKVRESSSKSPPGTVAVVAKAMTLLDLMASRREVTSAQLAELMEEPRSSVHRLINTLMALDVIESGARRGTYNLGSKLLRLGSAVVARLDVRDAALPVMERIHEETEETVFLFVPFRREAICIERLEGRRAVAMQLRQGGSMPLHHGAAPRVLLAFDERSAWDAYIDGGPLPDALEEAPVDGEELKATLTEIRERGYEISDEDVTIGFAAVGAPIFNSHGKACGALSVSGMRAVILGEGQERVRDLVVAGAAEASRSLGYAG